MKESRRELLKKIGLLTSVAHLASLTPSISSAKPVSPLKPSQEAYWEKIRKEFNLNYSYAHFAGFLIASHPRIVREDLQYHRDNLDANPAIQLKKRKEYEKDAREGAARYLKISASQVSLTDSTTMGLATVYNGIKLRKDQMILTTDHDHYSTHESLKVS